MVKINAKCHSPMRDCITLYYLKSALIQGKEIWQKICLLR